MKKITKELTDAHNAGRLIPIVTAHSGCEGTHANSISHIKAALLSKAEFCEVDVYPHNGVLYLSHDNLEDFSNSPTLEECFLLALDSKMCFNLDMKVKGYAKQALELAKKYSIQQRIVLSGTTNYDDRLALDSSDADCFVHPYTSGETLTDSLLRLSNTDNEYRIINMYYKDATEELIELTKNKGLGLSLWTVNDKDDIRRLMSMGAMNITTCCPVLALSIRKELFGK